MASRDDQRARALPLRGARNVRDLGGYPYRAEDGRVGTTSFHAFVRAGTLGGLRKSDRAFLADYGVTQVVDVRSNFELRYWPDPYAKRPDPAVSYHHVPMLDQLNSSGFRGALPECMFNVYRDLLDHSADSLRSVMELLAATPARPDGAPGCGLFHCRAGKDRTGVIAMLLLGLAGVPDQMIVEDYAATQRYMGRGLEAQRLGVSVLLLKRIPRCLFEAAPVEMERTLAHLHEVYGSARDYLVGYAGCSAGVVDVLASRLRG